MNATIKLGTFAGLKWMARGTAVVGSIILWAILFGVALLGYDLPLVTAIIGSFLAVCLHWLGEAWHNLGHAWAARRTGYPMSGVMGIWILAGSLYPSDEPTLPGSVHIRRALGGPLGSALMALVAGVVLLLLRPIGGLFYLLAYFFFLDNLLVLTLGAFLPLGFTDGSTILKYWSER